MSSARILLYIALAAVAVAFPPIISSLNWNAIRQFFDLSHRPIQLFGLSATAGFIIVGYLEIKDRVKGGLTEILPVVLFLIVSFSILIQIVEYSYPSTDYENHQRAVLCLIQRKNPYTEFGYTYPPLLSEIMTLVFRSAQGALSSVGLPVTESMTLLVLFYMYQCAQFFVVLGGYLLLVRMARHLGMSDVLAAGLVALLFLCNNPLVRTLKCNQMNMWVLDSMLLAYLVAWNRDWFSGLMIAIGTHVKLYPMLLVAPLLAMRKFGKVFWCVIFTLLILIIQISYESNLANWKEYLHVLRHFPVSDTFRDNSIRSLSLNIFQFSAPVLGIGADLAIKIALVVTTICTVVLMAWFAFRCLRREQLYSLAKSSSPSPERDDYLEIARRYGHFTDTMILMLLISPMVWEHHYVFAMPIAIWAIVVEGARKPLTVGLGVLLIFAVPTYNVFPLSYNRLAGLCLLATSIPVNLQIEPFGVQMKSMTDSLSKRVTITDLFQGKK